MPTWLAPSLGPSTGYTGYMIAECNFQFAHGYAVLNSNFGAANSMFANYLAVVLTDPSTTTAGRDNILTTTSENGGH